MCSIITPGNALCSGFRSLTPMRMCGVRFESIRTVRFISPGFQNLPKPECGNILPGEQPYQAKNYRLRVAQVNRNMPI